MSLENVGDGIKFSYNIGLLATLNNKNISMTNIEDLLIDTKH